MEELIIKEREFRMGLVNLVNNSNLPTFIMKSTLKEILQEVTEIANQDYETAVANIQKKEKEEEKEENENGNI